MYTVSFDSNDSFQRYLYEKWSNSCEEKLFCSEECGAAELEPFSGSGAAGANNFAVAEANQTGSGAEDRLQLLTPGIRNLSQAPAPMKRLFFLEKHVFSYEKQAFYDKKHVF